MSKAEAFDEAVRIAAERLANANFAEKAAALGIEISPDQTILIRAFGKDCAVSRAAFEIFDRESGKPVRPETRILILHYLLCDNIPAPSGKLISFRDLPGGQFYYAPFQARSTGILASVVGNDLGRLRSNLKRFDFRELGIGDLSAEIQAIGKVSATLVYRAGDEELPASAELLFDSSIRAVFPTEDVTFIGSLICRGLL